MAIPADVLQGYFREHRSGPMLKKKTMVDIVLFFATTPKKQEELLTSALNYDILNPVADGRENVLRSSEISVALFKHVFKRLPQHISREKFLISIFANLSKEAKKVLSQRLYTTKTGENITKTVSPFSIAYYLFLTMVFFDVSVLWVADFSRYSALLMEIQALKCQLRHDNADTMLSSFKLHNAITQLEQFKLNFLKTQYGLTIEMLSNACQALYLESEAVVIQEESRGSVGVENAADRLQFAILLELNKMAYGVSNTFGQLRFNEAKPRAHSDKASKAPPLSVSLSEGTLSFWRGRVSNVNPAGGIDEMAAYYHFAP